MGFLASIFSKVLISWGISLVGWIGEAASRFFRLRKQHNDDEARAHKVEEAKTHDEVKSAADDLP